MIAVILLLGPEHGRTLYVEAKLKEQIIIAARVVPSFQEYRFGEPYGDLRPSMIRDHHIYMLQETYDLGVEEGAVYIHSENCCEKTYEESDDYKKNGPIRQQDLPKLKDATINFGDPARAVSPFTEHPRMSGKSEAYINAVESIKRLIENEKEQDK